MVSSTGWFNSTAQKNLYKYSSDVNLQIVKKAQAARKQQDLLKLNEKYDGKAAQAAMDEATAAGNTTTALQGYLDRVTAALKPINDLKVQLLTARDAITSAASAGEGNNAGNAGKFDLAIQSMNEWVGRLKDNETSLIANTGNGMGSWSSNSEIAYDRGSSSTVTQHFLGNDYTIAVSSINGETPAQTTILRPDRHDAKLTGSGDDTAIDDWSLVSIDDNDTVTMTNTVSGDTYSGTISRGGLGMLNSWGYDGLDSEDGRTRALEDVNAALQKLARYEQEYNQSSMELTGMVKASTSRAEELNAVYDKVANKEVDAKDAEKKAIEQRYALSTNALALTSGRASNFINQMFYTSYNVEKSSLSSSLMQAAGLTTSS